MKYKRKNYFTGGILIIGGGLLGIIFYLIMPFDKQSSVFTFSIVLSIIVCTIGGIFLLLAKTGKPKKLEFDPAILGWMSILGTIFLVLSLVNPFAFPPLFLFGVLFWLSVIYEIWILIEIKRKKDNK